MDVLLWAEGSASRAVKRGPCGSKDIGIGKRRCHREFDPADADADLGADLSSFRRMVPHVASAKRVWARAMRRSALIKT